VCDVVFELDTVVGAEPDYLLHKTATRSQTIILLWFRYFLTYVAELIVLLVTVDHAILQSPDRVSGMTCHRSCVHHPAYSDCFKAHWRQYCFVL